MLDQISWIVFKCCDKIYLIGDFTFLRLTPEMVNCLAAVNKVLANTNQQQSSLLELYQQHHRVLDQTHSLKQFDLGFKKVRTYFVCKKIVLGFCTKWLSSKREYSIVN